MNWFFDNFPMHKMMVTTQNFHNLVVNQENLILVLITCVAHYMCVCVRVRV
jgi:hypothetical protein